VEEIANYLQAHLDTAPYVIFGLMLLAGINIPVSEDFMLFFVGVTAAKNPEYMWPLFFAVYLGAYLSDLIAYWMGRTLGLKLWKIKFFAKMVSLDRVEDLSRFYIKYGMITLIVGRFIPFGVRNPLFITAGMGKMNFGKFMFSDFIACTISSATFFYIYYTFGENVIEIVKKFNIVIFSTLIIALVIYLARKKYSKTKVQA
jgi:membrane-associated protein